MPLPPDIDPYGLSYDEWPPPSWQVPPVSDDLGPQPMPPAPVGDVIMPDPVAPPPVSDELAGAPQPAPMPWEQPAPVAPAEAPPAPLPPEQPDALTGGSLPGQFAQPAPLPPEYEAPAFDPTADNPFAQYTPAESFKIAEQLPPEVRAQIEIQQASRKRLEQEAALHKAAEDDLANIKRNAEIRRIADERTQVKEDQIQAEAEALAARGLDRKRWFRNADAAQVIGAVIGTLVGGAMSKPGQPNQGVAFMAGIIDKDIEDQKYEIENQRQGLQFRSAAVAREFARHGDLHRAAETVRQASYEALIGEIKTRQQDFDKNGVQYLQYGQAAQAMQARAAAAREESRRWNSEYDLKRAKAELDFRQAAETARHNRASEYYQKKTLESAAADRRAAAEARADEKAQKRADDQAERVRQFSVSSPRPVLQLDDKGKPVIGPDGKPVTTTQRFMTKEGKEWLLGDAESTRAMKDKIAAASEITDMIDEVIDIRNKVGGEIMPWSDAKQRLALLQERMRLVRKSGTQGMSSDKDFEALGASIGAKDLTSFIDQEPGLKEARERTVGELNAQMRTHNYDGPPVTFANRWGQETQNTAAEDRTRDLLRSPDETLGDVTTRKLRSRLLADGRTDADFDPRLNPKDREIYDAAAADAKAEFLPGLSTAQQQDIAALGVLAAGPSDDKSAAAAREDLQRIASEGKTAAIQQLARATLESALRSGIGSQEDTSTATRTDAPAPPTGPSSVAPPAIPDALRVR